jgi:hypothetical protein
MMQQRMREGYLATRAAGLLNVPAPQQDGKTANLVAAL